MKRLLFLSLFLSLVFNCKSQFKDNDQGTLKHIWCSTIISTGVTYAISYQVKNKTLSSLIGFGTSVLIGVGGKEFIYDKFLKKGTFSEEDIKDDLWGSACGAIIGRIIIDQERFYPKKWKVKQKRNDYY